MGAIFRPMLWVKDEFVNTKESYLDLVDVKAQNLALLEQINNLELALAKDLEEKAELERLRALFAFKEAQAWYRVGTRILAARFGPFSSQDTVMVDKGYSDGAIPGTPVVTDKGVYGKVLRAARSTATLLLITDPGFRLAVVSQETRTPGILTGTGPNSPLELHYVAQNAKIKEGEILVSSGVAGGFPKGVPVAKITKVRPAGSTLFISVFADPIVELRAVEEALLLFPPSRNLPLGFLPPQDSSLEMEVEVHKRDYGVEENMLQNTAPNVSPAE